MKKLYKEITAARIVVTAEDAQYMVHFSREYNHGKTWEFDPNSDAIGQYETHATGKMLVAIEINEDSMMFPEDAKRRLDYIMPIDDAREYYKFIRDTEPQLWFAIDMASEGELKGYDADMLRCMHNCKGCAVVA